MCKFKQIILPPHGSQNLNYLPQITKLYEKYSKFLQDDFAPKSALRHILNTAPNLWSITDFDDEFAGFVALDNFTGNNTTNFSAEVSTCFERKFWGKFTKNCAKIFFKKCFEIYGFYKIKALVFPDNFRVITLLKTSGFEYETTMPDETIRNGKLQDIDVYSLKNRFINF